MKSNIVVITGKEAKEAVLKEFATIKKRKAQLRAMGANSFEGVTVKNGKAVTLNA